MDKEEANRRLGDNEPITEEVAKLLDIHPSYIGATKEEVEEYLGIDFTEGGEK